MFNHKPPRALAFVLAFVITGSLLSGLDRLADVRHPAGAMATAARSAPFAPPAPPAPTLAGGSRPAPRS